MTQQPKRPRGTGSLLKVASSPFWYLKYQENKRPVRVATKFLHTTPKGKELNRTKAEALLQELIAGVVTGILPTIEYQKVTVTELADAFIRDHEINKKKSIQDAKERWEKHLKPVFGNLKAVQVNIERINKYIDERQKAGAASATINRELAALKRMFNLGLEQEKVRFVPHFPHLKENNTRTGFLEDSHYQALADSTAKVGLWLRAMFECGYSYGWRVSELRNLRVSQVDVIHRIIRLNPGETKNDDGRVVTMTENVYQLLCRCIEGKKASDYVFTRNNKPIADFRYAWASATKAAGVEGLLFHDLRRTAVRGMVRAGIPEKQAMMISGHKTRSVFDRYAIFNERDIREAVAKIERHHQENQAGSSTGQHQRSEAAIANSTTAPN